MLPEQPCLQQIFVEVKLQSACQVVRGVWGSGAGWGLWGLSATKPTFWTPARGKFTDEMWHRPMECNFKLPHLQERWNQVPNFTMMMSVRIHNSTGLGCQVPLHMFPPPLFLFFLSYLFISPRVVSWEVSWLAVSSHEWKGIHNKRSFKDKLLIQINHHFYKGKECNFYHHHHQIKVKEKFN